MALKLGEFFAVLGIDTGGYTGGILSAQTATAVFGQTFITAVTNPVLFGIDVLKKFAAGALSAAGDVLSFAESVDVVARTTGVAATTIQTMREAFKQSGLDAGAADIALQAFAARIGQIRQEGGPSAEALARVGKSIKDIGDGESAFRAVIDGLARMTNETDRANTANDLFGKQGKVVLTAIGGNSAALDELTQRYQRLGLVLSNAAIVPLAALDDAFGAFGQGIEGLKRSLAAEFLLGFASQTGTATSGVDSLAESIRTSLLPAVRNLGEGLGTVVGKLNELETLLNRIKASDTAAGFESLFGVFYKPDSPLNNGTIPSPSQIISNAISPDYSLPIERYEPSVRKYIQTQRN